MTGGLPPSSFGDSTAQPPAAKQTATSTASGFSNPLFDTSKIYIDIGYSSSTPTTTPGTDWAPRFAEDFSVFPPTPGNLRGSQGLFADFVAPYSPPAAHHPTAATVHRKRPLSVGSVAAETAAVHAHTLSTAPSLSLSPSPASLFAATFSPAAIDDLDYDDCDEKEARLTGCRPADRPTNRRVLARSSKARSSTKNKSGVAADEVSGQTTTPPPSAQKKSGRRLAPKPKPKASTMHRDQGYGPQHQPPPHSDFMTTPQQPHMATFAAASPGDLFGYPMSAPPTASAFVDARAFWPGADQHMVSMDVDYTAAESRIFNTPTPVHQQFDHIDWTQTSQHNQSYMLAGAGPGSTGAMPQQHPRLMENQTNPQQARHLPAENSSKQLMHVVNTAPIDQQALYGNYPTPVDNPFGLVSPNAGVDPGLLFSRPPSSGMPAPTSMASADSAVFDQMHHYQSSSATAVRDLSHNSPPEAGLTMASAVVRKDLRRTASAREIAPKRKAGERASASSPVKAATRPGLSRSASENRIPRLRGRASLPALAPALKPPAPVATSPQGPSFSSPGTGLGITRSASFGGGRPTGRSSPIRMQHQRQYQQQQQLQQPQDQQHHRLSSLTSIPEVNTPQVPASVKFTIDASGRARVETMALAEDEAASPSTLRRNQSARTLPGKSKWDSSEDDDSSSTDDEPIIIPSRTSSFALPDPIKPTIGRGPLHLSQRSMSDLSTTSTFAGGLGDAAYNDPESEAETVMNEVPKGAGDAASELEKLRQMRQKRSSTFGGLNSNNAGGAGGIVFGGASRGLTYSGSFGSRGSGRGGARPLSLQAVSPTALTADAGLPTPSSDSPSHGIRCICGRTEAPPSSDGFIVQCESCELWLHGRCINITKRTLPSVYICAFCAQTPSVRRMHLPPASVGSSPLAHKSFQSFR